jgi:hypothetical protein
MGTFDPEMTAPLLEALREAGVSVRLNEAITGVEDGRDGSRLTVTSTKGAIPTDLVVLAIGVVPEVSALTRLCDAGLRSRGVAAVAHAQSSLAKAAGLRLGVRESIVVDEQMRTSDPAIWAVGDAVEVRRGTRAVGVTESASCRADYGHRHQDADQRAACRASEPSGAGHAALRAEQLQGCVTRESSRAGWPLSRSAEWRGPSAAFRAPPFAARSAWCWLRLAPRRERWSGRASSSQPFACTRARMCPTTRAPNVSMPRCVHAVQASWRERLPALRRRAQIMFDMDTGRVLGAQAVGPDGVPERMNAFAIAIQVRRQRAQ